MEGYINAQSEKMRKQKQWGRKVPLRKVLLCTGSTVYDKAYGHISITWAQVVKTN